MNSKNSAIHLRSAAAAPLLFGVALVLAIGCVGLTWVTAAEPSTSSTGATRNTTSDNRAVGGDRDSHGCLGPAGYTWCELKQKCLRTFEEKCEKEIAAPSALTTPGQKGSAGVFTVPGQAAALWGRVGAAITAAFGTTDVRSIDAGGAEVTNVKTSTIAQHAQGDYAMTKADFEALVAAELAKLPADITTGP